MSTVNIGGAGDAVKVEVQKTVKNVNQQILSRASRALNAMRNAELDVMKGQRSGRIYKKPGGGTYRASAPGEPPARRTGNLRMNWNGKVTGSASAGNSGGVSINLELESMEKKYNSYMEHGTPGGKIAPRPYVGRIKEKAMPDVAAIYSEPYS